MSDTQQSDKPIARTLCGWCGSGHHQTCEEKGGWIPFSKGVHAGNQCKCHDTIDKETGLNHAYAVERSEPKATSKARRKSGR